RVHRFYNSNFIRNLDYHDLVYCTIHNGVSVGNEFQCCQRTGRGGIDDISVLKVPSVCPTGCAQLFGISFTTYPIYFHYILSPYSMAVKRSSIILMPLMVLKKPKGFLLSRKTFLLPSHCPKFSSVPKTSEPCLSKDMSINMCSLVSSLVLEISLV